MSNYDTFISNAKFGAVDLPYVEQISLIKEALHERTLQISEIIKTSNLSITKLEVRFGHIDQLKNPISTFRRITSDSAEQLIAVRAELENEDFAVALARIDIILDALLKANSALARIMNAFNMN